MPYIALNNQLFFFDCSTAVTCWNWEPCDTKLLAEKISRTPIRIPREISRKRIRCVFGQGYQYLLYDLLQNWGLEFVFHSLPFCVPNVTRLVATWNPWKATVWRSNKKGQHCIFFSEVVELWMGITLDLFIWMIWIQNPISNKSRILNQMQ